MTIAAIGLYKAAIVAHLTAALAGQGVEEVEGEGRADVPVSSDLAREKHRLYVRLEAFSMLQGNTRHGRADRHNFNIRVVHDQVGDLITDPDEEIPRIEGLISAALKDWKPLENSGVPTFLSSFEAEEPEPDVMSRVSRYQLMINGE
jgi:hypothetical protein